MIYKKTRCHVCKVEIERQIVRPNSTCFSCKNDRTRVGERKRLNLMRIQRLSLCEICNTIITRKRGENHIKCDRILKYCRWDKGKLKLTEKGIRRFGKEALKDSKYK